MNTILPTPNLSISQPSKGPNSEPPKRPNVATPETKVLDQLNSFSTALKITLEAKNVGPELKKPLTPPVIDTSHPYRFSLIIINKNLEDVVFI
tara:strand:+ start:137 stop:415 length:279 start_codon:yes stop_codon:yes gene_type:complete